MGESMVIHKDIIEQAMSIGEFEMFCKALETAGLTEMLKEQGAFTVLAPADSAFNKLPEGMFDELLKPANRKRLIDILTYHILPGRCNAEELANLMEIETINGQYLDIIVIGKQIIIDECDIIRANIDCSNGLIHVIDTVLLPE